jgi:hypothetical protein
MTTPDIGVQKITVQKQSLPSLDSNNKYLVRYRIKAKDGIATTAWSPVYRVTKQSIEPIFNPTTGTHNANEREIKSHGKSFDVSWKIKKTSTDLAEIPEQISGLSTDAYVRWGGKIVSASISSGIATIEVDYLHHFYKGQSVTAEGLTEDDQTTYTVKDIIDGYTLTVETSSLGYLAVGNRLWSRWEYVTTTSSNSFSVPIPEHHRSTQAKTYYAEFMVHLSTFAKDRNDDSPETLIFYSESVSTMANYDSGSIV